MKRALLFCCLLLLCMSAATQAQRYPIGQYFQTKPLDAWGVFYVTGFYVSKSRVFLMLNHHDPDTARSADTYTEHDTLELLAFSKKGELLKRLDTRMTDSMYTSAHYLFPRQFLTGKDGEDRFLLAYWRDHEKDSISELSRRVKIEVYDADLDKKREWLVNYHLNGSTLHYGANGVISVMGCCSTQVQYRENGQLIADSVPSNSSNDYAVALHRHGDSLYSQKGGGVNVLDTQGHLFRRIYLDYELYSGWQVNGFSTMTSDSALVFMFSADYPPTTERQYDAFAKIAFDGKRKWVVGYNGDGDWRTNHWKIRDLEGMHSGQVAAVLGSGDDGYQLEIFGRNGKSLVKKRYQHKHEDVTWNHRKIHLVKVEYDPQDSSLWVVGRVFKDQKVGLPDSVMNVSVFMLHLDQYGDPIDEEPNLIVHDALSTKPIETSTLACYPNPAQGYLHMVLDNKAEQSNYHIFTTAGALVQQGKLKGASPSIAIEGLEQGFYLLQVQSNERRWYSRFVKQ